MKRCQYCKKCDGVLQKLYFHDGTMAVSKYDRRQYQTWTHASCLARITAELDESQKRHEAEWTAQIQEVIRQLESEPKQ